MKSIFGDNAFKKEFRDTYQISPRNFTPATTSDFTYESRSSSAMNKSNSEKYMSLLFPEQKLACYCSDLRITSYHPLEGPVA